MTCLWAPLGFALWVSGAPATGLLAEHGTTAVSSFLPTEPGTLWVYLTSDGLKRIESYRSLEADGKLLFDVEELRGAEPVRRFSYLSGLEGGRWVRRGPDGEDVILSSPIQPGTRWRCGPAEVEVISSAERVQVAGGTFTSCVKLRKRAGDRETFIYLAPGVGVVRETAIVEGAERPVVELAQHQVPRSAPADETEAIRAELERLAAQSEQAPVTIGGPIPAPKRIAGAEPQLPAIAQRLNLKGTVVAQILIERDGSVSQVEFLRPARHFDEEVRRAVATWKYEPVLIDGKPVRALLTLIFKFE